jgi:hypothetical protein
MYPSRQTAIVFSCKIEAMGDKYCKSYASPWDTGTFYYHIAPKLGIDNENDKLEKFKHYSFRYPDYREYMLAYVASCFLTSSDYLERHSPVVPDPLGAMGATPDNEMARIFEVRFYPQLPVIPRMIEAVFFPSAFPSRKVVETVIPALKRAGVELYYDDQETPVGIQEQVTRWMLERTKTGGTP